MLDDDVDDYFEYDELVEADVHDEIVVVETEGLMLDDEVELDEKVVDDLTIEVIDETDDLDYIDIDDEEVDLEKVQCEQE